MADKELLFMVFQNPNLMNQKMKRMVKAGNKKSMMIKLMRVIIKKNKKVRDKMIKNIHKMMIVKLKKVKLMMIIIKPQKKLI